MKKVLERALELGGNAVLMYTVIVIYRILFKGDTVAFAMDTERSLLPFPCM